MVPSVFVAVDSMPLSPNGKVDRSLLPAPEQVSPQVVSSTPGATALEGQISRIWSQVLNREVGPTDNFFDLGGDSLQLIEVHSELQKNLDRQLSIMDLFEFTTIRSLAEHLESDPEPDPGFAQARERARKQKESLACQKQSKVAL
jgi:acyl carrier protein